MTALQHRARKRHYGAESRFAQLVDRLYGAATDPERWPEFLGGLARATGSETAAFLVQDVAHNGGDCMWQFGVSDAFVREYPDWVEENLIMRSTIPLLRTGALLPNNPVSKAEVLRSRFYNDFLRHHVKAVDGTGACILFEPPTTVVLTCNRLVTKPDYGSAEHEIIRALLPHLQRAFSIHRRLGRAEIERASSSSALDELACGVLFIDERGKLLLCNRSAQTILDAGDGLTLSANGEICAARSDDQAALRRLVGAACAAGNGATDTSGGAMPVQRRSLKRSYSVIVAPLRVRGWQLLPRRPAAVVFVTDPDKVVQLPQDRLRALFQLTPAEARLAAALAARQTVEEYAEHAGISSGTARWTLKKILEKTGCRRQSELMLLLVGSAAATVWE